MKCSILGFTRLSGNSKRTGNPYDFYSLGVAYKGEKGYTGQRVKEIAVDPRMVVGIDKLPTPITADIAVDFSGNVMGVSFS